jgi:hypothetical protein
VNEKLEIASRLREEIVSRFGTIKAFAESVQKTPQYLNVYLSGINTPGTKVRRILAKAGLDVPYIISGRRGEEPAGIGKETSGIMRLMKEKKISSVEELRDRLEREEAIRRLLGSDVYSAFLEVAVVKEKLSRYEPKKKRR